MTEFVEMLLKTNCTKQSLFCIIFVNFQSLVIFSVNTYSIEFFFPVSTLQRFTVFLMIKFLLNSLLYLLIFGLI